MNFSDPSAATTILHLFASGLIAVPITVLFLTKTARPTSKKEKTIQTAIQTGNTVTAFLSGTKNLTPTGPEWIENHGTRWQKRSIYQCTYTYQLNERTHHYTLYIADREPSEQITLYYNPDKPSKMFDIVSNFSPSNLHDLHRIHKNGSGKQVLYGLMGLILWFVIYYGSFLLF